jgi:hypothetical protein
MKAYGGVDVYVFLTSALAGSELSASRPYRFTPGERASGTHWRGGWVDRRAGPDILEKRKVLTLPGLELLLLGRPARIQSLYRLRSPSPVLKSLYLFVCSDLSTAKCTGVICRFCRTNKSIQPVGDEFIDIDRQDDRNEVNSVAFTSKCLRSDPTALASDQ